MYGLLLTMGKQHRLSGYISSRLSTIPPECLPDAILLTTRSDAETRENMWVTQKSLLEDCTNLQHKLITRTENQVSPEMKYQVAFHRRSVYYRVDGLGYFWASCIDYDAAGSDPRIGEDIALVMEKIAMSGAKFMRVPVNRLIQNYTRCSSHTISIRADFKHTIECAHRLRTLVPDGIAWLRLGFGHGVDLYFTAELLLSSPLVSIPP